jgi:ATP-dependent exoDNAse (exonuclease V) alpha subunit
LRNKLTEEDATEVINKLNTRVVSKDQLPHYDTLDDIYICGINEQVNLINKKYKFEVGSKVICNMTCKDLEKNTVANGDIGIVISIAPVRIQWDDGNISTFKSVGKNKSGKPRFTPAMALTVHKAQGKTIKRHVIINPTRLFSKNHLYVALTRATKFSNVYFTHPISMHTFSKTVNVIG